MAATLPDVIVSSTIYTDLYDETGIAVGTAVVVQNKGNHAVFLQTTATAPAASSTSGVVIAPLDILLVDAGEAGLFARSVSLTCNLSVQSD